MIDDPFLAGLIALTLTIAIWWVIRRHTGCDPKRMPTEKAPETLVAEVESVVAEVVERSLRENSADWLPVEMVRELRWQPGRVLVQSPNGGFVRPDPDQVKVMGGVFNPKLDIDIETHGGPGQCTLTMHETVGPSAVKRVIELQPVQRARIWQAAKRVLDSHEAAQRIEALADVVERIGGSK